MVSQGGRPREDHIRRRVAGRRRSWPSARGVDWTEWMHVCYRRVIADGGTLPGDFGSQSCRRNQCEKFSIMRRDSAHVQAVATASASRFGVCLPSCFLACGWLALWTMPVWRSTLAASPPRPSEARNRKSILETGIAHVITWHERSHAITINNTILFAGNVYAHMYLKSQT